MGPVTFGCPVTEAARRFPERPALVFEGRTWTWREASRLVSAWERWLRARGVGPGQRVACLTWNRPELVWLWFALGRRGASLVPLNARLTPAELAPLVERAAPNVALADPTLCARLARAELFPALEPAEVDEGGTLEGGRELAALFTSGTTGVPSLVPLTVSNFVAAHTANAANLGASERQVWLGTLPLFHVGGLAMAFRCAVMGAGLLLEPQFDAPRAARLLKEGGVTHASFVPTALQRVLDEPGGRFPSAVEAVLVGGGPMGTALLSRARAAGLPVLQTYGLTEACSQVTTERPGEADGATAGVPLQGLEVEIVTEQGRARVDEVGVVRVRGPTVTPAAGPWLSTGDLGSLDARGRLTVHARRVDLIVSGGENVYPAEVEAVLRESGLVDDVAVVPAEDATWGQVPVAFVVWRGEVRDDALLTFARSRLAGFKVPRRVLAREALPRNASGKLQRHLLGAASLA